MIYLFYGSDREKIREKARGLFESLREKKPDASFGELSAEEVMTEKLQELVGGMGLFENKCVILASNIFSNTESREIAEGFISELGASTNIFILTETAITKALLGKLEKKAEKVQSIEDKEEKGKQRPDNFFFLADALGRRDRVALWSGLISAFERGAVAEELHGILFWQVKSMILADSAKNAGEAGLNPYVFTKSKGFLKNFKTDELEVISDNLVSMYHEAHRGKRDFGIALERFALGL